MITNQIKSKKNIETIELVLTKACSLWKKTAPEDGDTLYQEIQEILRYNKELAIQDTYKRLIRTHKSSFFPMPAAWCEALEYAKQHPTTTYSQFSSNWLDHVKVGNEESDFREIAKYEKEVIDLVKAFGNCHQLGIEAKQKGYWDEPRANYSFIPSGFTAYAIDIFKKQFVILNKIKASFCLYVADCNYCNSYEFKNQTLKNGIVSADLLRNEDIEVFRKEAKARNERDNQLKAYSNPTNISKNLANKLKEESYWDKKKRTEQWAKENLEDKNLDFDNLY